MAFNVISLPIFCSFGNKVLNLWLEKSQNIHNMKKLLLLLAMVGMLVVACTPGGVDDDNNGNPTEQPGGNENDNENNDENGSGSQGGNGENKEDEDIIPIPTNEIWYTTTDGNIVTPQCDIYDPGYGRIIESVEVFGAALVSNTYENGKGIITFDAPVTLIGRDAFRECTSLTSITIPDSVTSIGEDAFNDCTSLKEVYCKPTTPPRGEYYMFDNNAFGRKIYVPRNSVEAYKAKSYWSDYADHIEGYDF